MTIWRMFIAYWIPKLTNAHSEYVILTAFPLQHLLHERASTLRYTYIVCLVFYCPVFTKVPDAFQRTVLLSLVCKVHPRTGHKSPEGEWLYSFFNLGSRFGWVFDAMPRPLNSRDRNPAPIV